MPSFLHQALVDMLREHPELIADLLRRVGTPGIPRYDTIVVDSSHLGAVIPRELAADCVLRFEKAGRTALVLVIEVQLSVDPDKLFTWPAYTDGARLRHRCDVILVVVTPDRTVADWARRPIVFGPGTGHLQPHVIGPGEIPAIVEVTEAALAPHLAVLSAIAHGHDEDVATATLIADTALHAVFALSGDRAQLYYDYIWAALGGAARKALDMLPRKHEYQHPGLRRANAEGMAEGMAQGKAEGMALGLLGLIEARRLTISPEQRAQILACADLEQLRAWIAAAATTTSVDTVIPGPSTSHP